MLEKVCMKELEDEAMVLSELSLVQHPDDVMLVEGVLLHDVFQILGLFMGKFVVHLSVPSNLYSINRWSWELMVPALNNLGKWALSQNLHNLVSIC